MTLYKDKRTPEWLDIYVLSLFWTNVSWAVNDIPNAIWYLLWLCFTFSFSFFYLVVFLCVCSSLSFFKQTFQVRLWIQGRLWITSSAEPDLLELKWPGHIYYKISLSLCLGRLGRKSYGLFPLRLIGSAIFDATFNMVGLP